MKRIHIRPVVFLLASLAPGLCDAASPEWMKARDAEIRDLLGKMTLAEKVGQMTQPDYRALKDRNDVGALFLGSVLCGGTSDPEAGNTLKNWTDVYEDIQKQALGTRLGIPLVFGVDAVHGHNNVLGAVVFPHNVSLGCARDPDLVARAAAITARETRATGIQWTFAPCVTVPRDIRWGRTYEGYSEDPAVAATLGRACVLGLQGERIAGPVNVLACAKHFVGDGGTTFRSTTGTGLLDQGDTRVDEATLRSIHLPGYPATIDAGVGTIMPSYSSWNGVKCTGNKRLLTDILKGELGFDGFIISDYNAIDQLVTPAPNRQPVASNNASGQTNASDYRKCIAISINAGVDMVMVTDKYRDFIRLLQELVNDGTVPVSRIDDAVTRILRIKFAMGMMDKGARLMADPALAADFGSAKHREVAREAVRRSLVLLKNEKHTLPLGHKSGRIHVTGRGADDLGMQCGGWTIDWQGKRGEVTTGGTTLLQAIRKAAGPDAKVTHDKDGSGAAGADVAVVVVGERPYAEMEGDTVSPQLADEDAAVIATAKSAGVPVVAVILSGRPILLGSALDKADAVLAAWLPGTEGGGVADVIFGDHAPTGKLSFTWPRSASQIPVGHRKEPVENPLFPLGFGLGY
ncbi:MAG: glycoside hydrolase family 3 C-terminal domain-containing protein [Verrucomicrobia bacterium]|nr:glycoside hydrolase family 3 C-terminal domain-containing protein [Verrucomicrobiota bacterium]